MKNFVIVLLVSLISISSALADLPCWDAEIIVDFAYDGEERLTLFNLPDGGGSAFNQAQSSNGSLFDATITVTLVDCYGVTVANFPAEDLWLASNDGGLVSCVSGTMADHNTDETGSTSWSYPLRAGGHSLEDCSVVVSGWLLSDYLPLQFNSADMNGDGYVNLSDVTLFSEVFFGDYDFSADFYCDGEMNIADVARLATGIGSECP